MHVPESHHDVVVVGARCAGAATAMLLARAGHDVVLVDRAPLPSDTLSTHALVRGGVVQLSRWGLLDDVVATGAPVIRSVAFHHAGEVTRRTVRERAGVDLVLAPRRFLLDDLLATAAERAGARLLTRATATGVLRDARGRVAGVTVRDHRGSTRELRARVVIGADGVRSALARYVGAGVRARYAPAGATFYTYVGDQPWDGFEFHVSDRAFAGVFPTNDGQACVWLIRRPEDLSDVICAGADRMTAWLAALDATAPELASRVRAGRVEARLRGSVGLPNHVRRAAGRGWALVGDAGYHRDPITGHGITDAFRDAELLSDAVDDVLRGELEERAAMTRYQRERDSAIGEVFRLTRAMGGFPPPEEFLDLQVRLSKALDVEAQALAARPTPVGDATSVA